MKKESAAKSAAKKESKPKTTWKTSWKTSWLEEYGAVLAALFALAVLFALVASFTQPAPTPTIESHARLQQATLAVTATPSVQAPQGDEATNAAQQAGQQAKAARVLAVAAQTENARALLGRNATTSVFFINATALAALAAKQPVVYAGLGAEAERYGVFEVRFAAGNQGLLVIVGTDAAGAPTSVLREFPVVGVDLGTLR